MRMSHFEIPQQTDLNDMTAELNSEQLASEEQIHYVIETDANESTLESNIESTATYDKDHPSIATPFVRNLSRSVAVIASNIDQTLLTSEPQLISDINRIENNQNLNENEFNEFNINNSTDPINECNADEIPPPRPSTVVPKDLRQLTLKNLDTGEEFIIGENDPDFEFDTFELCANQALPVDQQPNANANESNAKIHHEKISWWRYLFSVLFTSKTSETTDQVNNDSHKRRSSSVNSSDDATKALTSKSPFTKLSSFKFRKELGRGAFGRVLLAEAKSDGQLYALKIISKKNMKSSDKRQAKAERDILLAMGHIAPHPFTAGLRFAFQSENNLYLGMDFLPGGNLKELIKRCGCLPEEWARLFAAELLLAISHLHSLNVIYRDIKPHNVMIDGRGHVVLIDFGLSKQDISHPRGALSLVGTPDYSAPEVLKTGVYQIEQSAKQKGKIRGEYEKNDKDKRYKKDKNAGNDSPVMNKTKASILQAKQTDVPPHIGYGRAADWWSLGIMIYEMISGTPAFRGQDLRQTYQRVLYSEVEFKPSDKFSAPARLLIAGLLQKDPSNRLGSWNNPPRDIMDHSFFDEINWERVYERQVNGPWVPEPVVFGSRKHLTPKATPERINNESIQEGKESLHRLPGSYQTNLGASPPPISSMSLVTPIKGSSPNPQNNTANIDISESVSERESVAGRPSEMIQLRDSILAFSKGQQANRIPDWSFFDESILVNATSPQQDP